MNENALNSNVGLKLRSLRLSRNVKQADAAVAIGPPAPAESYLHLQRILEHAEAQLR